MQGKKFEKQMIAPSSPQVGDAERGDWRTPGWAGNQNHRHFSAGMFTDDPFQIIQAFYRSPVQVIIMPAIGSEASEFHRVNIFLTASASLGSVRGSRQYASRFTSRSEAKLISASRHWPLTLTGNLPLMGAEKIAVREPQ